MKKLCYILFTLGICHQIFADISGIYVGGGLGYGMQSLSLDGASTTTGTPTLRTFVGYQFADWVGAELGYTYITQSGNWMNAGNPSTTVYDLAFTPGIVIPATPVSIYLRLGVDAVSANLNSSWYNQMFSNMTTSFEWGIGTKVNIPTTHAFIRLEYTNYGGVANNNNQNMSVTPSTVMINAAYVF